MDRNARLARIYETIRDIPKGRVASYIVGTNLKMKMRARRMSC